MPYTKEKHCNYYYNFQKRYITHNKKDDAQCNKENGAPTTNKKQHTYNKEDDMLVAKKMTCLQQGKQRTSKKIMCIATKTRMCMDQRRQCATKMMCIASEKKQNENN